MQVSEVLAENSALLRRRRLNRPSTMSPKYCGTVKIDLKVVSGPGDKIFGMLSERDIVRVFADQGADVA